jgi:predicted acyltransferase
VQLYILSIISLFSNFFPNAAIPLNKQLYTFSYVCVTSGAAALVFSAIYILVFFCHEIFIVPFHEELRIIYISFEYGPMLLELRLG